MYELTPFHDLHLLETVLDIVLYSLYVMICDLLDLLHLGSILRSHCSIDVSEGFEFAAVKICELRKRNLAKSNEIFDFDTHAVLDECVLAEIFSKRFCLTGISSVDRRHCQK